VEVARDAGPPADPGRIAAQVVTGVGFIGAGMILRSRVSVTGITSAATVWFISATGLVVGYGNYVLAGAGTVLMVLTLSALDRVEKRLEAHRQLHIVRMRVTAAGIGRVREVLQQNRVTPEDIEVERADDAVHIEVEYVGLDSKHAALIAALQDVEGVDIQLHY
jgi:putative Mg2+ transporter-C (MgtC) family protein